MAVALTSLVGSGLITQKMVNDLHNKSSLIREKLQTENGIANGGNVSQQSDPDLVWTTLKAPRMEKTGCCIC